MLVVHYQVLYLSLEPLVAVLEGHILLGLPRDLVVTTLHFVLRLLVFAGQGQVLFSKS